MYRILVVDDEENIREVIKEYAEFEGHQVSEACDGMQAVEMVKNNDYDIIIMDVMMPRLDGYSACKEIRKIKQIPVLMLSARGEEYDKLFGFELGIDDYVVKPFSPKELMLRVDAVMKRTSGRMDNKAPEEPKNEIVSFADGGLKADLTARIVYVDGERVEMTPKEYDLFFYMIKNKNIALTRDKLISEVWGYDYFGADRTVDVHIKRIREKLGESPYWQLKTVYGVGYKFEVKR